MAGALWLTPLRNRLGLSFQTIVNGYFNNERVAEFLSGALQWLSEPLVVLWDGGTMHKGDPINELAVRWQRTVGLLMWQPVARTSVCAIAFRAPAKCWSLDRRALTRCSRNQCVTPWT